MKVFRFRGIILLSIVFMLPSYATAQTVRSAVGKPLQQAEALLQKKDYRAALARVQQASAVRALSPYETLLIEELRAPAEAGAGNFSAAAHAYEVVLDSGSPPAAERLQLLQAIASLYYRGRDYPNAVIWVNRYIAARGSDAGTRALLAQSYYEVGDYAHAEQAAWQEAQAQEATGGHLAEGALQLLASSAQKSGDKAGYEKALEALLVAFPNQQYWNEAISLVTESSHYTDDLTLSVYRLRRATNTLTASSEFEDYAERAVIAGQSAEASAVIDQGFANGILTNATDGGHAARLRASLAKGVTAPASNPAPSDPVNTGVADFEAGWPQQAVAVLKADHGYAADSLSNPAAVLARLWVIQINNTEKHG